MIQTHNRVHSTWKFHSHEMMSGFRHFWIICIRMNEIALYITKGLIVVQDNLRDQGREETRKQHNGCYHMHH